MELELTRTYLPNGTNGKITNAGKHVCFTIELPWKNNQQEISCIPEGRYELAKRYSIQFGWHVQVMNIPHRDLILIHPANNALKELKGCIAPVSILRGEGIGYISRIALKRFLAIVNPELTKGNKVYLTIKSNPNETTH
jgi:hypothetical protein